MLLLTYGFYKSNFIEMENRVIFSHGEKNRECGKSEELP